MKIPPPPRSVCFGQAMHDLLDRVQGIDKVTDGYLKINLTGSSWIYLGRYFLATLMTAHGLPAGRTS